MIKEDIQKLDPGSQVELYELDLSPITGTVLSYYFHGGTNSLRQNVTWQGKVYTAWPIEVEGFELTVKGTLPRPKLRAGNRAGALYALCKDYQDLVDAKLICRRTLVKYLDAVNFSGGNASADPNQAMPDEVYFVERKVADAGDTIEWELVSALDLAGFQLPNRTITVDYCQSGYRRWNSTTGAFDYTDASECGYTGGSYFDILDQPVGTASADVCSKKRTGCKARFGSTAILPFGGFPGSKAYAY